MRGIFPQAKLDRDAGNCFFEAGAFFLAGHMFSIAADAARFRAPRAIPACLLRVPAVAFGVWRLENRSQQYPP